ncbi:MAG: hypothetical protein LBR19_04110 [Bifidobacteriaceae bacterium]|jgi:hypothetical protein|nr:hypothetical protein [Bifidobacteriaceae bacterium]
MKMTHFKAAALAVALVAVAGTVAGCGSSQYDGWTFCEIATDAGFANTNPSDDYDKFLDGIKALEKTAPADIADEIALVREGFTRLEGIANDDVQERYAALGDIDAEEFDAAIDAVTERIVSYCAVQDSATAAATESAG